MNQNMGIGELGSPNTNFSRKFRWSFFGKCLPPEFVKDVKFNYVTQTITFSYYDVVVKDQQGMHAFVWADSLQNNRYFDEVLTFIAYDGCGKELYKVFFEDLSLLEYTADFDYSDSEVATTKLTINYGIVHKKLLACPDNFKRFNWKIIVNEKEFPMRWRDGKKMFNLEICETPIDHLNSRIYLPGKCHWDVIGMTS